MAKLTQADIDAGLTQADVDAGLRSGQNERISDKDRARALRGVAEMRNDPSIVDMYRDYSKNPEAKAFSVKEPRNITGEDLSEVSGPRSRTSNEKINSMLERLGGGNRVGMIPPRIDSFGSNTPGAKKGGAVNKMAKGGSVKSGASKRADGCAVKGKTKGRMV